MDAFFVAALVGSLAGYILGDLQRELRFKRDVRANLALAVDRTPGPVAVPDSNGHVNPNGFPLTGSDGDGNSDGPAHRAVRSIGDGQARRRAVSRAHVGNRPLSGVPVRAPRGEHAASLRAAGYDCG